MQSEVSFETGSQFSTKLLLFGFKCKKKKNKTIALLDQVDRASRPLWQWAEVRNREFLSTYLFILRILGKSKEQKIKNWIAGVSQKLQFLGNSKSSTWVMEIFQLPNFTALLTIFCTLIPFDTFYVALRLVLCWGPLSPSFSQHPVSFQLQVQNYSTLNCIRS